MPDNLLDYIKKSFEELFKNNEFIEDNKNRKAVFVMVDGLDGAGKGFVVDKIVKFLEEYKGYKGRVLDIRRIGKQEPNYFPEFDDIKDKYNVLVFREPSHVGVGLDLREEIFKRHDDRSYSVMTQAMAFAIQREILYKRLVIKALREFDFVIAERGVITSVVFQPLYSLFSKEKPVFTVDDVVGLPGNKIALSYLPDYFLITKCPVDTAMDRLGVRQKKDNAIYETREFQERLSRVYNLEESIVFKGHAIMLDDFFKNIGSVVKVDNHYVFLDTSKTEKDSEENAKKFIDEILKSLNSHF